MENIRKLLDIKLFSQPFNISADTDLKLDDGKFIAQLYMRLENCISVLSDLKARRSYIYYGAIAEQLGLQGTEEEINSIWEDELLSRVHTEDCKKSTSLNLIFSTC